MRNLLLSAMASYKAVVTEIPGTGSGVSGTVVVFAGGQKITGYGGFVEGLPASLVAASCTETNGCGVHIHNGFSCENATVQGGHYFVDPVLEDPWVEERYSSDLEGKATFSGLVEIGTDDLEGRAFIIHAEDGSRLGCGMLTRIADTDLLTTSTDPLEDSTTTADAIVYPVGSENLCMFGSATNLEPNLLSFVEGGESCMAANGCGVHVHSGFSCTNTTTQEGHFYNKETLASDPWVLSGYASTDASGSAYFIDCLTVDVDDCEGRAFIVHTDDGKRSSCGMLEDGTSSSAEMMTPLATAAALVLTALTLW